VTSFHDVIGDPETPKTYKKEAGFKARDLIDSFALWRSKRTHLSIGLHGELVSGLNSSGEWTVAVLHRHPIAVALFDIGGNLWRSSLPALLLISIYTIVDIKF